MKQLLQILAVLLILAGLLAGSVLYAQAAPAGETPLPEPPGSELPPDLFDENCDGGAGCPGRVFLDMPPAGHWAHLPIDWALSRHVTSGTAPDRFSPNKGCTRAQAVTFLWKAMGAPEPRSQSCPFEDVPRNAYYRQAVLWAVERGVTSGMSPTRFGSNVLCKRAQIITFLWRAKGSPASGTVPAFRDVAEDDYYRGAVAWAVARHITGGVSPREFGAAQTCTRAQIVGFLYYASRS